jgi:hypothetical protein
MILTIQRTRIFFEQVAEIKLINNSLKLGFTFHHVFDVLICVVQKGLPHVLSSPGTRNIFEASSYGKKLGL